MLKLSITLTAFALWWAVITNVNAGSLRMTRAPSTRQPADLVCPNAGDFNCGSGECISQSKRCDNKKDCYNGRDEDNCPIVSGTIHTTSRPTVIISGTQGRGTSSKPAVFVSGSQQPSTVMHDIICPNAGDFNCGSGECISQSKRCDNKKDCYNGRDEDNCLIVSGTIHTTSRPTVVHDLVCPNISDFNCGAGICIPMSRKCDDRIDCWDGQDEKDCPIVSGTIHTTSKPTVIISEALRTQQPSDFVDKQCEKDGSINCGYGLCISGIFRCDRNMDCWDGRDEKDCVYTSSTVMHDLVCQNPGDFNCGAGECIPMNKFCDSKPDCSNGRDELTCASSSSTTTPRTTRYTGFRELDCANPADFNCGRSQCFPQSAVCDYKRDCWNGLDEQGCSYRACTATEYQCNNKQCIPLSKRCDNNQLDCYDGSDEFYCSSSTTPKGHSGTDNDIFISTDRSVAFVTGSTSKSRFGTDNDVQISTDRSAPFVTGSTSKSRFGTDNDVQILTDRSSFYYRSGTTAKRFGTDNDVQISTDRSAPFGTSSTSKSRFGTDNDVVSLGRSTLFGITTKEGGSGRLVTGTARMTPNQSGTMANRPRK